MTGTAPLIGALRRTVGEAQVLTDPATTAGYVTDWTGRYSGAAAAVVRPGTTEEVAAVLTVCASHGVAVVPQGGNTGLVGGGVPRDGEVLLSLRRLDDVGEVDTATESVVVGAGATLAAVQVAAAASGLAVGVDLAARDSATIGGMVATNAGGIHVVAHGSMRAQVLGLEAVLPDGRVMSRIPGLAKDNAGYDLPALLTGSEGTLAVITRVHLRLHARPRSRTAVLIGCADVPDLLVALAAARRLPGLRAAEMMRADGVALTCRVAGLPSPFDPLPPLLLLLEHGGEVEAASLAEAVADRPAVAAVDAAGIERLWAVRERHTEALSADAHGALVKLDVTVPLRRLTEVISAIDAAVGGQPVLFGHVAEGTLHVNVLRPAPGDTDVVLGIVAEAGGSIASEHGIGRAKADRLHLTRGPAEIAAMWAIKRALDPRGLLNPGVVLTDRP